MIYIDCRYTRIDHPDGISRFSAGIAGAVARLQPVTMIISDTRQLDLLPDLPWVRVNAPTSVLEPLVALRLNRLRPELVFSTMQTMGTWFRRYPVALTVHDLIYYVHRTPPKFLPRFVRALWRLYHLSVAPQRWLLGRADAVATVSHTTAALMRKKRMFSGPIHIVTNASEDLSPADMRHALDRMQPQTRKIVYVGSFMPYKNVAVLIDAFNRLPDYELHLVSGIGNRERAMLESSMESANVVFHDGMKDSAYQSLLQSSFALVSASLDEGFGIPVLEAMKRGTPVVTSDIPIFREITGAAGIAVSPVAGAAFATALRSLEDPRRWKELSERGLRESSRFSWSAAAEAVVRIYEEVGAKGLPGPQ